MRDKIYFITDSHLGIDEASLQRERQLCALLDEIKDEARMVIFLGDIFDFWFTYRHVVPRGMIRLLGRMAQMADDGVELHFFIGNHDMWLFDYLTSQMKITMHDAPAMIEYDGKRFLMGHGDGLGHTDPKYDRLKRIFRSRLNQRLLALVPTRLTFGIANAWSHRSRQSHGAESYSYQGDAKEGIVVYCRQQLASQQIDYCVFGHRHTPQVRTIAVEGGGSSLYVNVGDWLEHRNYAVYSPAEGLILRDYEAE